MVRKPDKGTLGMGPASTAIVRCGRRGTDPCGGSAAKRGLGRWAGRSACTLRPTGLASGGSELALRASGQALMVSGLGTGEEVEPQMTQICTD
jgi:hypothetical protein